jgi:HTH-type transcriptional regulator/antitoxin HigA
MEIKPIHSDQDYKLALHEIEQNFNARPGMPQGDRLEVLVTLVEVYESHQFAILLPDPIEAILYHMERLGLARKDLEPMIGGRARISEVLNRKRPLTIRMIRNLSANLGISAETLLQEYPLAETKSFRYPPSQLQRTNQIADHEAQPEGDD